MASIVGVIKLDTWIKWLGELVWRLAKVPKGVQSSKDDKDFFFRAYGILTLLLSLLISFTIITKNPEPFFKAFITAFSYDGPEKLVLQGYLGVAVILIIGVPVVVISILSFAAVLALSVGAVIRIGSTLTPEAVRLERVSRKRDRTQEVKHEVNKSG